MTSSNHHPFAGRWIARINTNITACGGSPDQVYRIARAARFKEIPLISYIPLDDPMNYPPIFFEIQQVLQNESGVYLVGGAVRDALLGLTIHDLDFVCLEKTKAIARNVANGLHGAFYAMDESRQIFRVLLDKDGVKMVLDFAAIRGKSLEEDQINRDFSVNAIAVDLQDPQKLFDPTGGAQAIISKKLIMCSPSSFTDDPIRIIRGVRLAAKFGFTIEAATRTSMKSAVPGLSETTIERIRDEFFKIIELLDSDKALKALIWLGCDRFVLPVLEKWQHPEKRSYLDTGIHALSVLYKNLNAVVVKPSHPVSQDVLTAMILNGLSGYREFLWNWFDKSVHPERSRLSVFAVGLLHLPAYLADQGSQIPQLTAEMYHLSNIESAYLQYMSNAVIQLHEWTNRKMNVSKRSQYKYYKEFGSSGVDACIAALAIETAAVVRMPASLFRIEALLAISGTLLNAWMNEQHLVVNPATLLTGDDLIREYGMTPGPQIGNLLEYIREKQAAGEIVSTDELPALISDYLSKS